MQPKLFEKTTETIDLETVLLYALGGCRIIEKKLIDRELAFDRLRGAFLRGFQKFGIPEMSEEQIVQALKNLGAIVSEVPKFVAKRPFRITIGSGTASEAVNVFRTLQSHQP